MSITRDPVEMTPEEIRDAEIRERNIIKVAPDSDVFELSESIGMRIVEEGEATIRAIGVGAVNQAVKSTAIARTRLGKAGYDLYVRIKFETVIGKEGDKISALVFDCEAPLS